MTGIDANVLVALAANRIQVIPRPSQFSNANSPQMKNLPSRFLSRRNFCTPLPTRGGSLPLWR